MITIGIDESTGIMEIVVRGIIKDSDFQGLGARLEREKEARGELRILEIVEGIDDVEPSFVLTEVERRIIDGDAGGRAAIVTDESWKSWFHELLHPHVGNNVRIFKKSEIAKARDWLLDCGTSGTPLGEHSGN